MTTHILIIVAMAVALFAMVRARLIQVDLFFPWFVALLVLGFASTQPAFVNWAGSKLGILYAPIAVVFLVIFLVTGVVIALTVSVTRLRSRQIAIVNELARLRLDGEEQRLRREPRDGA